MKIRAITTKTIEAGAEVLEGVVDRYIPQLADGSIVAVASKVVALCEGRVVERSQIEKQRLVRQEAEYYWGPEHSRYGYALTVKHGLFVGSAGVDESNGGGYYVLLPADPQVSANGLRRHLAARDGVRVGVIVTDSRSVPLRRGALGVGLAHSGFSALCSYAGQSDVFGRPLQFETAGLLDGLAAAAVAVMGEGAEHQPLAVLEDLPSTVHFQDRDPLPAELAELSVTMEDDLFADLLLDLPWEKRPNSER